MADAIVQALGLPFKEANEVLRSKIPRPASGDHASWTETFGREHARALAIAGAASRALLADFQAELAKARDAGTTLADWRKTYDDIVKRHGWQQRHEPGWRAKIIYETNMATSYAAGRYLQMTDPDVLEAYPYWRYVHSGSQHPRLQHLNWNGMTLRANDPWWNVHYPPSGWHCRCRVSPISEGRLQRSGRSGPDPTPETTYRPWTDKRTGQTHMVPNGCDPGWGYNPGKAWKEGAPPPVAPRPPPVVPPVAAPTAPATPPPVAAPKPERPRAVPKPAAGGNAVPPPVVPPLVAPGTPVQVAADFRTWTEALLKTRRADGTVRVVGEIPPAVMAGLSARDAEPSSPALGITAAQLLHLARDAKQLAGKGLSLADLVQLPALLASAHAVLRERSTGNLLFVTDARTNDGRVARMVVTLDMDATVRDVDGRRRVTINAVKSASMIDPTELGSAARFDLIDGEV